jgi:hypothetical protein
MPSNFGIDNAHVNDGRLQPGDHPVAPVSQFAGIAPGKMM